MSTIRVIATSEEYADGFNAVVDVVARERKYIGFVEGSSPEITRKFVQEIINGAGVQMLAVTQTDHVVGWCDIIRNPHEGFRHVGRLGMGVLADYRGHGLAGSFLEAPAVAGLDASAHPGPSLTPRQPGTLGRRGCLRRARSPSEPRDCRRSPDNRREEPAIRADGTPPPGAPGARDWARERPSIVQSSRYSPSAR